MKATRWEFENRAVIIGGLFAAAFLLVSIDPRNAAQAVAERLASWLHVDGDRATRAILPQHVRVANAGRQPEVPVPSQQVLRHGRWPLRKQRESIGP
jgi:hypothetical protein